MAAYNPILSLYELWLGDTTNGCSETSKDPRKQGLVAPQAVTTELLVAGLAQRVCFVL